MLAATPSLARSESFTRSKVSPRLVVVSGTSPPPNEVFVSGRRQASNSESAQTRNLNPKTSRPFVLAQAPRGTPQLAKTTGRKSSTLERPSTSGGVTIATSSWNRAQWEDTRRSRESRDDTYFALMKADKVESPEITAESFPMPTALPTPDATPPRGPSPEEPVVGELPQMNVQDQNVPGIGMALGSPMHPQHDWAQSPSRANTNDLSQGSKRPNESVSPVSPQAKQKQSKWKGFGSLFGRKAPKPSPAFYQLDNSLPGNSEVEPNGNPTPPDSADSRTRGRGRSNTTTKSPSRQAAPTPTRANTAPVNRSNNPPAIQVDGGMMLDVEIPNVHLDRYSVMFGGVLGKNGMESSSSLLARRQATLDKLKTVNEAIAQKEKEEADVRRRLQRRATESPAFSLFPSTPSHPAPRTPSPLDQQQLRPNPKSGLSRSNTSPATMSPNRSTFHSDAESHIIMLDDGKALLNGISQRSATNKKSVQFSAQEDSTAMLSPQSMDSETLPYGPNQPARGRRLQESSRILSPPSDSDEEEEDEEVLIRSPLKPRLAEPDWKIINPSEPDPGPDPFKKEIDLIERLGRGRSGTLTQQSVTPSTNSTAQSSMATTPTSDILNIPMSPLRSNPTSPQFYKGSTPQSISQTTNSEQNLNYSTSTSSSATSRTTDSTATSIETPRRARSIREIRADINHQRQRSASRSAVREQQREAERARVQAELEEAERTLESAAGLSIARQISVSQKQRQLLLPIQTRAGLTEGGMHRKGVASGSSSSSVMSSGGLGSSRENDAMLLSSGGFNGNYVTSPGRNAGGNSNANSGFDFNHYERPPNYRQASISSSSQRDISPTSTRSTERSNSRQTDRAPSRTESHRAPSRNNERKGVPLGASTMSAGADSNGRIQSTINMGAMGMGSVATRQIAHGTPTVVEPHREAASRGLGHRYQRSERVVLDG